MRFTLAAEHLCSSQSALFTSSNFARHLSASPLPLAAVRIRASLGGAEYVPSNTLPHYSTLRFTERFSSFSPATWPSRLCSAPASASLLVMASTATEPVEVLVKAATGEPDKLGDCPFSQRVLITLEEKGIPYNLKLVDTANKPQWFLEANPEGKVPVYKRHGEWLADSDAITSALEEDFPDSKKLGNTPEESQVGGSFFGAFVRFLKGSGSEEDLLAQFQALDDALKASGGPFVAGKEFTAVDARLAPALYHAQTALKHFKNWSIPSKYSHVLDYIKALESRDSFKKTAAPESVLIAGWNRALGVTA